MFDDLKSKIMLTTIAIATMIATPSTQSTGGLSLFREGPKSWKNPRASDMIAAMDNRIYDKDK